MVEVDLSGVEIVDAHTHPYRLADLVARSSKGFDTRATFLGEKFETLNTVYPNVYDGAEGMLFITQCVKSSQENGAWVPFRHSKSRK